MKPNFYFLSAILIMSAVFFSCDNKESEEAELNNHILVNETQTALEGMIFSYDKRSEETAANKIKGSYPLDIYLYASRPYFKDAAEGGFEIVEDSAPMIHFSLFTTENGIPDSGDYMWTNDNTEAGNCISAWQCTNMLGLQSYHEYDDGVTQIMIPQYEQVSISVSSLKINKLEDKSYEFFFESTDIKGNKISGYYKGSFYLSYIIED